MGMPSINIEFKKKAQTAKLRSARGVACIIVKDSTVSGVHTYTRKSQVVETYDADNKSLIEEGFDKYGVKTVTVLAFDDTASTLADELEVLKKVKMNYLACNFLLEADDITALKAFVEKRIENNMDVTVVATNEADNKNFVNFVSTGIKVDGVEIPTYRMNCKVAFILASLPQTESATYYVLDDITAVDELDDEDTAVEEGKLFITFDGEKYKLSRGVNSLVTVGANDKEDFKKIKIVEEMALVRGDIYTVFRDNYVGKCNNTYTDRISLVATINKYLTDLAYEGVLNIDGDNYVEIDVEAMRDFMENELSVDTTDMLDVDVAKDKDNLLGSRVFLKGYISTIDSMEDLLLALQL